jgi:hypothetical protein
VCGEVVRGGCLFAGTFRLTNSTLLTRGKDQTKHDAVVAALVIRS